MLIFRTTGPEFDPESFRRTPFFRPVWLPNIIGMRLEAGTDWDRVERLVIASYRALARKTLIALME